MCTEIDFTTKQMLIIHTDILCINRRQTLQVNNPQRHVKRRNSRTMLIATKNSLSLKIFNNLSFKKSYKIKISTQPRFYHLQYQNQ